ncbi:hypothetical protein Bca52824_002857 [Brassica carinata]|uniref:TF-B3 domain-containing protein n=1 Tax=Brassica carinata TaxID=52824 RepID=A0A8X8BF96_BRACI|nr:hypothetical protein Bca52824_002857 [Brassica carinata]
MFIFKQIVNFDKPMKDWSVAADLRIQSLATCHVGRKKKSFSSQTEKKISSREKGDFETILLDLFLARVRPRNAPKNELESLKLLDHGCLSVPIAFFRKHVQGSYDHIKTAKLRTDASDKTWLVKVDGLKLTDGWKDFAGAHDLRVGDIIIFRHEGDMVFHVTPFGPSCCAIQYTSPSSHNINDDSHDQTTNKTGTRLFYAMYYKFFNVESYISKSSGAMSFDHCFLAEVIVSNLKEDKLYFPVGATSSTALNKQCQEMLLVNKEGKSWTVSLRFSESGSKYYISRGWRKWCVDNSCDIGDLFGFNLKAW